MNIGGIKFTRPKGKRTRAIPLPAPLVTALHAHLEAQQAERDAAGDTWQDWDLVWCQANGHPIDTHVDWEEWKAILGQAEIKDVRLHDARHTAGTLLGELHVDIHVIQRILGHAQVTTTRIYTDPTDPLTREAANRIGGLLWPDEPSPETSENIRRVSEIGVPEIGGTATAFATKQWPAGSQIEQTRR
jgi:site-specific recombinase XerD